MSNKSVFPALLLIAAGLVIGFGNKTDLPEWKFPDWFKWSWVVPSQDSIEGTRLLLVYEKKSPSIEETMAIRSAKEFCETNKLAGYLAIDRDDDFAAPLLTELAEKHKLAPPVLVAAEMNGLTIKSIKRARAWKTGLQDILK